MNFTQFRVVSVPILYYTRGFLVFSGDIKREYWPEIGQKKLKLALLKNLRYRQKDFILKFFKSNVLFSEYCIKLLRLHAVIHSACLAWKDHWTTVAPVVFAGSPLMRYVGDRTFFRDNEGKMVLELLRGFLSC